MFEEKYYTLPELAKLWKCSPNLIYVYLRDGRLEGFKLGNSWRITDAARQKCETRLTEKSRPTYSTPVMRIT